MQDGKAVTVIGSVLVSMAMLICGCAMVNEPLLPGQSDHTYGIGVDSLAVPGIDLRGKTYVILSAMQNVSEDELQFQEFARYVENALSKKGCIRKNSGEGVNMLISLAYWIGEPQTVTSTQTYTTSLGYSYPVGWMWYTVPPQTRQETSRETLYKKTLVLEAYDQNKTAKRSQLWKTTLRGTNPIGDLRVFVPYMLTAGVPYFGVNSGVEKEIDVYGRDPMILEIRK
ncbi:DUF4136 domain-containing protein [bacterium]|nr:DUF4136 domain-containing protein [bacterium]